MNSVFLYIIVAFMALVGGGSTIAMVIGIPAVIIWKIYRKIRFGYSITD